MNARVSLFVTGVEVIIYLLVCNFHHCNFNKIQIIGHTSVIYNEFEIHLNAQLENCC